MPKRSRTDPILIADRIFKKIESQTGKNPFAVALGKLGGPKGGPARAKALTPQRRAEIARQAAKKRWSKSR